MEAHRALTRPASPPRSDAPPVHAGSLAGGALALALGASVYALRPSPPPVVGWLDAFGAPRAFAAASRALAELGAARAAPAALLAHGSDAAFALAVALFLRGLWGARSRVHLAGVALVLGHEALQGAGLVAGTFDVVDAVVMALAYALVVAAPGRASGASGAEESAT